MYLGLAAARKQRCGSRGGVAGARRGQNEPAPAAAAAANCTVQHAGPQRGGRRRPSAGGGGGPRARLGCREAEGGASDREAAWMRRDAAVQGLTWTWASAARWHLCTLWSSLGVHALG